MIELKVEVEDRGVAGRDVLKRGFIEFDADMMKIYAERLQESEEAAAKWLGEHAEAFALRELVGVRWTLIGSAPADAGE